MNWHDSYICKPDLGGLMKVQTKFAVLLLLIALTSAGWMLVSRLMEQYEYNHWLHTQQTLQEKKLNNLLSNQFREYRHLCFDLTFGNELNRYLQGQLPPQWAATHLKPRYRQYNLNGVWVYRQDATLVYGDPRLEDSFARKGYLPHLWIKGLHSHPEGTLSFISTTQGIMAVTAIPLWANEKNRSAPSGYLLIGKLLDSAWLGKLGNQWEGDLSIRPIQPLSELQETNRQKNSSKLIFYRTLLDVEGNPIALLQAQSHSTQTIQYRMDIQKHLQYSLYYFLILFLIITWLFYRSFYLPLRSLQDSLTRKETGVLSPWLAQSDEFGSMARLIRDYFEKEERLDDEISFRQQLLDSIPLPVYYKNTQGVYLGCNKAFESVFGLNREMVLGKTTRDIFTTELAQIHENYDKRLIREGGEQAYHQKTDLGNGIPKQLIFSKALYRDREGSPLGIIGTAYDITDRKRAEESLEWEVQTHSAIIELAKALLSSEPLEKISARVLEHAKRLTGSHCGYIGYYDLIAGTPVYPVIDTGVSTPKASSECYFNEPFSLWKWAQIHHTPLLANQPEDLPKDLPEPNLLNGLTRILSVPAYLGESLEGLLVLANAPDNYTGRDLMVAERLITLYSLAIQRVQSEDKLKTSESHLRRANRALHDLVEFLPDATFVINLEGKVTHWNRAIEQMTGIPKQEILGKGNYAYALPFYGEIRPLLVDLVLNHTLEATTGYAIDKRDDAITTELFCPLLYQNEGAYLWATAAPLYDSEGKIIGAIESIRDITDRKKFEEKLREAAFHDSLTGLPNRALFMPRLDQCLARARRHSDYMFAVLFLDLDRFKEINDKYGHLAGDRMLVEVGVRLKKCVREVDTVARLGGDEFVILMEEIIQPIDATRVAERILAEFTNPVVHEDKEIIMDTSIGVVLSLDEKSRYRDTDELFRDADTALYQAKESGRCRYALFDIHMQETLRSMLELESDLRKALHGGEFEIRYQPILRMEDFSVKGFEALVYWRHPDKGIIPPKKFIPIAEDIGLIVPLGEWIIRESCRQLIRWKKLRQDNPLYVSVNIALSQVEHHDFRNTLHTILKDLALKPTELQLEINETTLIDNPIRLRPILMDLRAEGYRMLLDNFGTGESSIGYLIQLPIEALKIDKEFIFSIHDEESSRELIKVILSLTNTLKLDVIAEGVETPSQLNFLKSAGCQYAQGFFFAKPMTPLESEEYYGKTT